MAKKIVETPLMKQYLEMKRKHPDALLLFRVGDFYETFSDDAIEASKILGITLTRRANGAAQAVELAGFPHHALDTYLPRLVRAGRRVAICEQLEDPKTTKKLVKRGITELITPGLNTSEAASTKENNFLGAVHFGKIGQVGVAFLDINTGEFLCAQGDAQYVDKLLANIAPREVLRLHGTRPEFEQKFHDLDCAVFELDDWVYTRDAADQRLLSHFGTSSLKGFGVDNMNEAIIAAGSILYYLDQTCHNRLGHITALARIEQDKYVRLDRFTIRNLELIAPLGGEGMSLYDVVNRTLTPMGARMMHRRLLFPLLDLDEINRRLDSVERYVADSDMRREGAEILAGVGDVERLFSRLATRRAGPRELLQLRRALLAAIALDRVAPGSGKPAADFEEVAADIARTIDPDTAIAVGRGPVIAAGVDPELDELRQLAAGGRAALDAILRREIDATGIPSLKIAFNNVFGYYIEVRNTHRDKVPPEWIRRQTLVSAERYITPELKEYEAKITGAQERIAIIENRIFSEISDRLANHIPDIQRSACAMAATDCEISLANVATDYGYCRPLVDDSLEIDITEGRHPVIERRLPPGENYISNSVNLSADKAQIMMVTGPNMSGKSALLRQTALIALLAQTGSFVPAQNARIGYVDKIFTRVGASDNISAGESTFMVEMTEAASILNNMGQRSLILFDELGRGTSTYDGISIAWSVVEHIHENGYCRPRTLFATHYHELNEMEKTYRRIVNVNVSVSEADGKVVFLRKLARGGSAHSFGIHVARLAGMPPSIVKRAGQVLESLEKGDREADDKKAKGIPRSDKADVSQIATRREGYQMSLFQIDDPVMNEVRSRLESVDPNNLTPLQALNLLSDLKAMMTM